jgi:hypothetical protein
LWRTGAGDTLPMRIAGQNEPPFTGRTWPVT